MQNKQAFIDAHFNKRWYGHTVKTADANAASINYLIKNRRYSEVSESKSVTDIFAACDDDAFIQLFKELSKRKPAILVGKAADINSNITVAAELLSGQPQAVQPGVLKLAVSIRRNSKVALAAYTYLKNQYEKSKGDAKSVVHEQLFKLICASKKAAEEFLTKFKTHKWNWSTWKRESILLEEEIKAFAKAYWGDVDIQPLIQKKYPQIINQMIEELNNTNVPEVNSDNESKKSDKSEKTKAVQESSILDEDTLLIFARENTDPSQFTTEKQKEFLLRPIILAYIAKNQTFSKEIIWQFLSNQDLSLSRQFQLSFPITRLQKNELFNYLKELPESEQDKINSFRDNAVADSYFATVSRDLKMLQAGRVLYANNPNGLFANKSPVEGEEQKGQDTKPSPEQQPEELTGLSPIVFDKN